MTPEYKKNDASALFFKRTDENVGLHQNALESVGPPAEAGGPFLSFVFWKFWRLTIHVRLSIIKIRKGAIRANG